MKKIFDAKNDIFPSNPKNLGWFCPICRKKMIFCYEEGRGIHFKHVNNSRSYNQRKKCYNCPKILFKQKYRYNYSEEIFRKRFLIEIEKEMNDDKK